MGLKRHADGCASDLGSVKRPRRENDGQTSGPQKAISHPVLSQYYPTVLTLREYVLSRLPSSSRIRRKKIRRIGRGPGPLSEAETRVSHLLDTTYIGAPQTSKEELDEKWKAPATYSQNNDESDVTLSDVLGKSTFSQAEIVDFTVWLLFSRDGKGMARPKHLLCDGFRKSTGLNVQGQRDFGGENPSIPGLLAVFPNHHVGTLKSPPWPELLVLLGKAGERVMVDLLLECGVFVDVYAGTGNMWQLSGVPLSDMEPRKPPSCGRSNDVRVREGPSGGNSQAPRSPADISFVRSRILYARAALTAKGNIQPGFRHIHILNRAPYIQVGTNSGSFRQADHLSEENTLRVMAYMFPRQFGLHNVFTSNVDRTRTAQKFQDYTLREEEISAAFRKTDGDKSVLRIRVPKRLRGDAQRLVQRLQILHTRCSYISLFEHYCPSPLKPRGKSPSDIQPAGRKTVSHGPSSTQLRTAPYTRAKRRSAKNPRPRQHMMLDLTGKTIVDLATSVSHVSRFCQTALSKIIPNEFWGTGPSQKHNKEVMLRNVDRFIRLRRFESMSLHEAIQGIKISGIHWLAPPNLNSSKMSQTDKEKRTEIFYEFLYYIFDSLLIPLIRCNFYVTESSKHKHRLFYFRHDVWRCIAEPATTALKANLLEEVNLKDALRILESRKLGTSHLRLLPKGSSLRPVMNLKRRAPLRGNPKLLGPSINSILAPVSSVFNLEKELHPFSLGSSMFSVSDIYNRLKAFRSSLSPLAGKKLYFVKVDVQSAFDTMPQDAVVRLMKDTLSESQYTVSKYVEVKTGVSTQRKSVNGAPVPVKRWKPLATAPQDEVSFPRQLEKKLASNRRHTIFVNGGARRVLDAGTLHTLLKSHVEQNLIKIGKKYYRQSCGVPQGSVLSTTLCNYLYADLEHTRLSFLGDQNSDETLLLRLIDDFLLITTNRPKAVRFVEVMHAGLPEYGVTIKPEKSLVNFDVRPTTSSPPLARCTNNLFPYCGTLISTSDLSLSKDRSCHQHARISDSLTVEASRRPGHNFARKTLNAFRLQSHMMFYDTTHNAPSTTLANLRAAFTETARKTCAYVTCLPSNRRPSESVVVGALRTLVDAAYNLLTSKERRARFPGYECAVSRAQVGILALREFRTEMRARQLEYSGAISWIDGEVKALQADGKTRKGVATAR